MTIEILWLAGRSAADAEETADKLLADLHGHPDLRRLLVLDDTATLVRHTLIYERLVTARRVEDLLCVALGPRAESGRGLQLPGNLGGTQGSGVLWVSDPRGIDWRVAASAIAIGHPSGSKSGLDHLVELLSVDEVFDRVCAAMTTRVPGRVASPGLRLAGADDEAATFAGALAVAIRRLTEPGQGVDGPFRMLLPGVIGGVSLAPGGDLARCHADVLDSVRAAGYAVEKLRGLGGMIRRGQADAREHVIEAGAALADLRHQVDQLLRETDAAGELIDNQRARVLAAGVQLPGSAPAASDSGTPPGVSLSSPVTRVIDDAIRGGDTIPLVARRLALTERELKRLGSASYLPEVEQRCPASLLARLADPPRRHAGGGDGRRELGLDEAAQAADRLADLVLTVANREWSPATPTPGVVASLRIALDGAGKTLTAYPGAAGEVARAARRARLARLGETLTPTLRELVLKVLITESASPSADGQRAFENARDRTAGLLADWTSEVHANGVLSRPSFATASVPAAPYAGEDDVAEIKEAVKYEPAQVMWQLCGSGDLGALDVSALPQVVWFAPRLNRDMLVGALPPETVWTSSGSYAGLLRLVPLRTGVASSHWGGDAGPAGPSHLTEPSR
jgi:hypothetical protein